MLLGGKNKTEKNPAADKTPVNDPLLESITSGEKDYGQKPTSTEVELSKLKFDFDYQRNPDLSKALRKTIKEDFSWLICDPLTVNKRSDGTFYCIDGQNRTLVLRELGESHAPAELYDGLTPQKEAEIFVDKNKYRKAVTPLDIYFAEIAAGHPETLEMKDSLTRFGIKITRRASKPNESVAANAFRTLKAWNILEETAEVVTSVWAPKPELAEKGYLNRNLLIGIGTFLRYQWVTGEGMKITPSKDTLIEMLKTSKVSVDEILLSASRKRIGSGGDQYRMTIAKIMMDFYNRKHRGNKRLVSPAANSGPGRPVRF